MTMQDKIKECCEKCFEEHRQFPVAFAYCPCHTPPQQDNGKHAEWCALNQPDNIQKGKSCDCQQDNGLEERSWEQEFDSLLFEKYDGSTGYLALKAPVETLRAFIARTVAKERKLGEEEARKSERWVRYTDAAREDIEQARKEAIAAEKAKWVEFLQSKKRIKKPGHGPCCTCQNCGYSIADGDDCECDRNAIIDDLLNSRKGEEK